MEDSFCAQFQLLQRVQLQASAAVQFRLSLFYDLTQRWLVFTDVFGQSIGPISKDQTDMG